MWTKMQRASEGELHLSVGAGKVKRKGSNLGQHGWHVRLWGAIAVLTKIMAEVGH
jgi:hypothetical protein